MRDMSQLHSFLDKVAKNRQPEGQSDISQTIVRTAVGEYVAAGYLTRHSRVLDVGCGSGLALMEMKRHGLEPHGLAVGESARTCRTLGFHIIEAEQEFSGLADASYDFLWSRHMLSQSIMPVFALSEYHRLLAPGGLLYVEVAAPDTDAHHERNPNSLSQLPVVLWQHLFYRTGFIQFRPIIQQMLTLKGGGKDTYWCFLLKSKE
ncbi:MAG: class I SAM-dependent methyltransferase [Magnetococcales bacterium]|nr:class I SAM-dependent methyltransferase [Magnetococcales bacterium]NGZ28666.1 class I SAM-dependent methyltransferase [Magnetococcales bacterium]